MVTVSWVRERASLLLLLLLVLCLTVPEVRCYFEYQARIPNGAGVPHPCGAGQRWPGVGHFNVLGGGERNAFGLDFAAAGHAWTGALCRADSDRDGRTNGEELGDPQCTWTPGQIPQFTSGITHPGVCDPFQDAACSRRAVPHGRGVSYATVGEWMEEACVSGHFNCPATKGEDVQQIDFRLPVSPVPDKETTYMCQMFVWPDVTEDFHVIATEPIINNSFVLHHMLLFGCSEEAVVREGVWECQMGGCQELLSNWGVGITGHCFHDNAGVRVGRTGFSKFMIQYHWNNPQHHRGMTDSSGMTLHYSRKLRPYNMGMLWTGQSFLHIPPSTPHTLATSDCSSSCTRALLSGDIQITSAVNHMHLLGKSMNIELHRCDRFLMNITDEPFFDFNSPKFYEFPNEVRVKPGDMIRTNCHFNSETKNSSTFFGLGTADEMCLGFLSFYPKENMPRSTYCISWKDFQECDVDTYKECDRKRRSMFSRDDFNETALFISIISACKPGFCTEECKTAVRFARKCDPCLHNAAVWPLIQSFHLPRTAHGWQFSALLAACDRELEADSLARPDLSHTIVCPDGSHLGAAEAAPRGAQDSLCEAVRAEVSSSGGVGAAGLLPWGLAGLLPWGLAGLVWGKLCLE